MNRMNVINTLLEARGYESYLEIGCQADVAFNAVRAKQKIGIDPVSGGTLRMTSDEFFALNTETFDLIFIDGDHHHDQVFRDISNSLRSLKPRGTIVMHDCFPPDLGHEALYFCGTAWRAFVKTRERPDLESFVCAFDYGVGIVRKLPNSLPVRLDKTMDALTYDEMIEHRARWMRPVTFETFQEIARVDERSWNHGPLPISVIRSVA